MKGEKGLVFSFELRQTAVISPKNIKVDLRSFLILMPHLNTMQCSYFFANGQSLAPVYNYPD